MGCRYDNSTGIFHNYRVPERGRKKIMNELRHAQRDDSLPVSTLLFPVFTVPCIYIHIQRLHLLHARCSQAKHVRDSEELIHHLLGPPNLAAAVKSAGRQLPRAFVKVRAWQEGRMTARIVPDSMWFRNVAQRASWRWWSEEERGWRRKGRGERTVPFIVLSFLLVTHVRQSFLDRTIVLTAAIYHRASCIEKCCLTSRRAFPIHLIDHESSYRERMFRSIVRLVLKIVRQLLKLIGTKHLKQRLTCRKFSNFLML